MDAYHTPDVEYEERGWQIVLLAYIQPWLAESSPGHAKFSGVPNVPNRQIPGVPIVSTFRSSGH